MDGSSSLRSSVRKAGLSNLFHVNTFSSFLRHNSVDDTANVVSNGDVSKENVAFKRSLSHDTYTQVGGCGASLRVLLRECGINGGT